eukprot:s1141_g6.t1
MSDFIADPELSAHCEAAGLELAVRAWWRGARSGCGSKEVAWLRKTAHGGVVGGAHDRLLRCGIPERVLHSGVQLGQVLAKDKGVTKNWQDVVAFGHRRAVALWVTLWPWKSMLTKTLTFWVQTPDSARCARSKRLFQEKLMEEVSDHFTIRMPSIPGTSMQLTPRSDDSKSMTSPRTPASREDGEAERALPSSRTEHINAGNVPDVQVSPPGSTSAKVRPLQGMRPKFPAESCKDGYEPLQLPRAMKVRPKLDTGGLVSYKLRELANRVVQEGDSSKGKESVTSSSPTSPKSRNFAEIFQATASKMLERESQWNAASGLLEPFSPVSPTASWNGWDMTKQRSDRAIGTPKLRTGTSSKFDEWAKKKVEQRFEEAKEEEGSRKEGIRKSEVGDSLKNSLLRDKAVASEVVNKKAVTDLNSIRRIFMDFDSDGSGLIEPPEFMPLLSKLLRRPPEDLDKKEVWAVWDEVDEDGSGTIDFDEFQRWYAQLMGIDILDYGESFIPEDISSDQILVRSVAKSLNRSILEVEKLYDEFKKLDTDHSNTLEMNEFRQLIQKEFAPKGPEVPEHVFKMFWKDFDKDGRGSVTFTDFCKWYLKFMKGEASPMEQYFAYMTSTQIFVRNTSGALRNLRRRRLSGEPAAFWLRRLYSDIAEAVNSVWGVLASASNRQVRLSEPLVHSLLALLKGCPSSEVQEARKMRLMEGGDDQFMGTINNRDLTKRLTGDLSRTLRQNGNWMCLKIPSPLNDSTPSLRPGRSIPSRDLMARPPRRWLMPLAVFAVLNSFGVLSFLSPAKSRLELREPPSAPLGPLALGLSSGLFWGWPVWAQEEGDPVGFALTILGGVVVLLGFGFVGWVFSLSPATDSEGRAKASSLAGLEDIEDKLEAMDKMTPEEADEAWTEMGDEYQMRRGGLKREKPPEKQEKEEFQFIAIPGADTLYTGAATVQPGDEVTVHATGLVTQTKTKFWSTKDAGQQPFTYTCGGGVIKGWDMGARGMTKGEIRGLRIPASEGYGGRGFPSWGIPPNADLLFEIEVLEIKRNGQPVMEEKERDQFFKQLLDHHPVRGLVAGLRKKRATGYTCHLPQEIHLSVRDSLHGLELLQLLRAKLSRPAAPLVLLRGDQKVLMGSTLKETWDHFWAGRNRGDEDEDEDDDGDDIQIYGNVMFVMEQGLCESAHLSYIYTKVNAWHAWKVLCGMDCEEGDSCLEGIKKISFDRYAVDILEDLCLPSSLRHLAFEGGFNQSFEFVKFPQSLESLKLGGNFKRSLERVSLPSQLQRLTLGNLFNQSLEAGLKGREGLGKERVHLPLKLRELTFGTSFNQSLENVTFPSELVSLTFGASFNQPLQSLAPKSKGTPDSGPEFVAAPFLRNVKLPNSLEVLSFGNNFNQSFKRVALPRSLQQLTFGASFNHSLEDVSFESFSPWLRDEDFNQGLDQVEFPSGLQVLSFGASFNQPLRNVTLPATLKSSMDCIDAMLLCLKFGKNFNQRLDGVAFPSNLSILTLGQRFDRSLVETQLPENLRSLTFGEDFNQSLTSVAFPERHLESLCFGKCFDQSMDVYIPRLKHLTFGWSFNHRLDGVNAVNLPNLQTLTLGSNFNQSLEGVDFPNLRSLTFGENFSQSLKGVLLPPCLEQLIFGYRFNETLEGVELPKSLKSLTFGSLFNQSLEAVILPELDVLTLGFCFNQSLERTNLPGSIRSLTFGWHFNQNLQRVQLPANLEVLSFAGKFNRSLVGVEFPKGLRSLTFGEMFNQSLESVRLPASLRMLKFGDEFNQDLHFVTFPEDLEEIIFGENFHPASWEHVTLPSNLLSLKFGKRFIQNLEDAKLPESLSSLSFASLGYAFEQSLKRARLPKHIQRLQTGSILVSPLAGLLVLYKMRESRLKQHARRVSEVPILASGYQEGVRACDLVEDGDGVAEIIAVALHFTSDTKVDQNAGLVAHLATATARYKEGVNQWNSPELTQQIWQPQTTPPTEALSVDLIIDIVKSAVKGVKKEWEEVFSLMFDLPELRLPNKKSVEALVAAFKYAQPKAEFPLEAVHGLSVTLNWFEHKPLEPIMGLPGAEGGPNTAGPGNCWTCLKLLEVLFELAEMEDYTVVQKLFSMAGVPAGVNVELL